MTCFLRSSVSAPETAKSVEILANPTAISPNVKIKHI